MHNSGKRLKQARKAPKISSRRSGEVPDHRPVEDEVDLVEAADLPPAYSLSSKAVVERSIAWLESLSVANLYDYETLEAGPDKDPSILKNVMIHGIMADVEGVVSDPKSDSEESGEDLNSVSGTSEAPEILEDQEEALHCRPAQEEEIQGEGSSRHGSVQFSEAMNMPVPTDGVEDWENVVSANEVSRGVSPQFGKDEFRKAMRLTESTRDSQSDSGRGKVKLHKAQPSQKPTPESELARKFDELKLSSEDPSFSLINRMPPPSGLKGAKSQSPVRTPHPVFREEDRPSSCGPSEKELLKIMAKAMKDRDMYSFDKETSSLFYSTLSDLGYTPTPDERYELERLEKVPQPQKLLINFLVVKCASLENRVADMRASVESLVSLVRERDMRLSSIESSLKYLNDHTYSSDIVLAQINSSLDTLINRSNNSGLCPGSYRPNPVASTSSRPQVQPRSAQEPETLGRSGFDLSAIVLRARAGGAEERGARFSRQGKSHTKYGPARDGGSYGMEEDQETNSGESTRSRDLPRQSRFTSRREEISQEVAPHNASVRELAKTLRTPAAERRRPPPPTGFSVSRKDDRPQSRSPIESSLARVIRESGLMDKYPCLKPYTHHTVARVYEVFLAPAAYSQAFDMVQLEAEHKATKRQKASIIRSSLLNHARQTLGVEPGDVSEVARYLTLSLSDEFLKVFMDLASIWLRD